MLTRRRFLTLGGGAALGALAYSLAQAAAPGTPTAVVDGQVLAAGGGPLVNARVTLFTPNLSYFRETRTNASGQFTLANVPAGTYELGACTPGRAYDQITVAVSEPGATRTFNLGFETHLGLWTVIGNTDPETFGGTNSGSLMADGRIFYCHDTLDPVIFNPLTGAKSFPAESGSSQGCHMPAHLLDGRLLIIGGGGVDAGGYPTQSVKTVRAFDPLSETWENWPDMNEFRWYPGFARLADGRFLFFGGGQVPYTQRTATCEILDPRTRRCTPTGSLLKAGGFGHAMQLLTGEVLCTWEPPQLYNPVTGQWRYAAPYVQPNRATNGGVPPVGDHPDNTTLVLPDGRVVSIGIRHTALGNPGSMVELYDPAANSWSLRANSDLIRSMPEVLMLPDGKILVAGGKKEDPTHPEPTNSGGWLKRADLYDPLADSWRRVQAMDAYREYHAITLLIPDGRVLTTAGTAEPAQQSTDTRIEAYEPPYLFRGVRPQITSLSATRFTHGQTFTLNVLFTNAVTSVVLIGMNAISHFLDGGVPRLLRLPFTQTGSQVRAQVPLDPLLALPGYYLLFAMVDDIPSEGRIVAVDYPYEVYLPAALR